MGCGASSAEGGKADCEFYKTYKLDNKVLGSGSYGIVKKCTRVSDGTTWAAKSICKDKLAADEIQIVEEEVGVMKQLDHKGCIKLADSFNNNKEFILVLELMKGGELFDRIVEKEFYSEDMAAKTIKEVGECLHYLHGNGIVHRDLKPENLLYTDNSDDANIKITDFGLAKRVDPGSSTLTTQCGTPNYVAPEILARKPYGCASDMWSAGCILYILLGGVPPFWKESTAELFQSILAGDYDFPDEFFDGVSEEAKTVIRKLLTINPDDRMTAQQLISDPWVNGGASTEALGGAIKDRIHLVNAKVHLRSVIHTLVTLDRIKDIISKGESTKYEEVKNLEHHAHGLSSDGDQQDLNESFKILDLNGDGELCAKVLTQALNALGSNYTEDQVSANFLNRVDADADGFITFEEFEFIMKSNKTDATHVQELERIFGEMDTDGDSSISPTELSDVLDKLKRPEPADVVADMVKSVDDNDDGEISFDEFLSMMGGHR